MGAVNPLKGGLFHATKLTTVSPRYAEEIRTPEGGAGLDGVLRFRGGDLVGILNGIDDEAWDPATRSRDRRRPSTPRTSRARPCASGRSSARWGSPSGATSRSSASSLA